MDILVAVDIAFVIAYFLLAGGWESFSNTWKNIRNGKDEEVENQEMNAKAEEDGKQINS